VTFRWRFGDGKSAAGATVRHAYRKAGRYVVTLVATDAAGHAAAVARTAVHISAARS
jgi:PKD repeat protein